MKSLLIITLLIVNVWKFRSTQYLTSYQIYTIPIFIAALLFNLGEYFRALIIAKGEKEDLIENLYIISFLTPFFRLLIDPILILKNLLEKKNHLTINLLHLRFFEIIFWLFLLLFEIDLIKDVYFQYYFLALGAYGLVGLAVLLVSKRKVFEVRTVVYSFLISLLQFISLLIVIYTYQHSFEVNDYFAQFLPIIIPETKVNHFSFFVLGLLFLSYSSKKRE